MTTASTALIDVLADSGEGNGFGHMWNDWTMGWGMGWGGGWMMLIWLAILGLIVWGIVALTRNSGRRDRDRGTGPTPREILDRRYAAGEIDETAYEQARRRLDDGTTTGRR